MSIISGTGGCVVRKMKAKQSEKILMELDNWDGFYPPSQLITTHLCAKVLHSSLMVILKYDELHKA